jgi:bacterial/archaeal transporter family protein
MERWKLYAFGAALFAGLTSVIAKAGLKSLGADLGLAVRTVFVFGFIMLNTLMWTGIGKATVALQQAGWRPVGLLAVSALTTTLSWVCYYRAMHDGTVSFVSFVDKGSILVTLALSVLLLGEPLTWRLAAGATLIIAGLLVLAGGKP